MKKIVMLSAAAILGLSGITLSQAEDVVDAAAETTEVATATDDAASTDDAEATETDATEEGAEEAAAAPEPAVEEEPIPEDTPQVKKVIALYPKLVERIQPYGKVCFEGDTNCDITLTASAGASADGEPRDGKAVFDAICHTCHATGVAGAPAVGDSGAWGPRIAQGKSTLYDHAINGFNAMPARGGADIPDEEVQNAVDYMVGESS
ncbi:c-type cytochrome [Psychrobacter sp. FDAARGOS_221]|uniref:c-type cytochrome n=1 Tax=Psychrobacter sp. FDAARGOS_221 TaxID=1975705 RepID=UPI000BB53E92|nr:c-type cytochrome [Psychrobacter sp. FDAARGOS_221]PNK60150.1 cytochrome c5 family protein [Psychrobacter sp. FDAARGOS_221]